MPTRNYSVLPVLSITADVSLLHPPSVASITHWDDMALQAMVDFKYAKAATIQADTSLDTALEAMKLCSYHVLLVLDNEQHVIGLVSGEDLLGQKPLKAMQERAIARAAVTVRMLMTSRSELIAFDLEQLAHAKVGQVVATLQSYKQQCALALELHATAQTIRGLFSLVVISKQLSEDVVSAMVKTTTNNT